MHEYSWPGNIRELENTLMQASLLCQQDIIEYEYLNLETKLDPKENRPSPETNSAIVYPFNVSPQAIASMPINSHDDPSEATIDGDSKNDIGGDVWLALWQASLENLVGHVCDNPKYYQAELGIWLEHRLFQQAMVHFKTNKRIASLLHLPISTARRKVQKAQTFNYDDFPNGWSAVEERLAQVASGEVKLSNPLHTIKVSLLRIILQQRGVNMTQAAQLLGVSEPTLYKLKREL
jgi:DNA-binding NtrC family response regulator